MISSTRTAFGRVCCRQVCDDQYQECVWFEVRVDEGMLRTRKGRGRPGIRSMCCGGEGVSRCAEEEYMHVIVGERSAHREV